MNTLPSASLLTHFKDYEQYHKHPKNKLTHLVGIPLVMFSLVGLLSYVVLWSQTPGSLMRIDLGLLLMLFGAGFGLKMDYKIGVPFALYAFANYLIARHLSLPVLGVLQAIGWIFQLWGHYAYEKKSPAFLTTISHVFVGPMWIFAWVTGYYKAGT